MRKLNPEILGKMSTVNDDLDNRYGKLGSAKRDKFDEESLAWFYGNMLRERRKELNLTQKQLADQLGREQSYIARVENGKADIQISSFFRIAAILGIQFVPNFIQATVR